MKKLLSIIILATISLGFMLAGGATSNQSLIYAGFILGTLVGIGIIASIISLTCHFIGTSLSSFLYLAIALALGAYLTIQSILPAYIGYALGFSIGIVMLLIIIRKIARASHNSIIFGEVFSFVSGYKVKSYIDNNSIIPKEQKLNDRSDYCNITLILNQELGLNKKEAELAAKHAVIELPKAPLEDKLQAALQYHDRQN